MVTTSLRAGEKLADVPEEFAGFHVSQYGIADRRRDYLRRLEFVLRAAGVPEAEVSLWSKRFSEELNNVGSVYYTETPGRWIAEALIACVVKSSVTGKPLADLRGELSIAITEFFEETGPAQIGGDVVQMSELGRTLKALLAKHNIGS